MRKGLLIKIILGLVLVALLMYLAVEIVSKLTETVVGMLGNDNIVDESGDYQLYTPEPMPTMPAYMGEDSFYDNAEEVDFGNE